MNRLFKRFFALLLAVLALQSLAAYPVSAAESFEGTVTADKVFLRVKASTDCDFYDQLNTGTKVSILGSKGDFYKVKYKTFTGFMMKKFIKTSKAAQAAFEEPAYVSKYAKVNSIKDLGSTPRASQSGASGDQVEKLQRALQIKGFLKGNVDGKYGNMTVEAVTAFQKSAGLSQTGKADNNTILKLFGKAVETTAANDPQMDGIKSISQISVPNTSRPGDSGKHVKALQQALKLKGYYKAGIDSSYGDKTVEAVKRYQKAVGLGNDGVAGFTTIRKLFGKNAANYTTPTERLDWFNGGAGVIPQWTTFTIKDIATGETFKARRWSGVNHLDAEPLTAEDAKVMKKIAGGSYSWNRRAVLVRYNGHVYAASINTMPHGSDTIPENNYAGHFCVHFYKSKTHDTKRVDGAHQNAVERAMNASW